MAVLATDAFTRADNADLGTDWNVQTGCQAWKIVSNQAQPSALTGANAAEQSTAATWPNDQYAQVVCAGVGAGMNNDAGVGVMVRAGAAAETFYCGFSNNDPANCNTIYKAVAGVYTRLGQNATGGVLAVNDVLYLEVQGTTLIYKRNGSTIFTVTDAAIASGRPGIILSTDASGAPILDSWEGGDFAAAGGIALPVLTRQYRARGS
jgi:hypothetical protein